MCIYLNLMILIKIIRGFIRAERCFVNTQNREPGPEKFTSDGEEIISGDKQKTRTFRSWFARCALVSVRHDNLVPRYNPGTLEVRHSEVRVTTRTQELRRRASSCPC